MQVKSTVKMNLPRKKELTQAVITALEKTTEALHTEVVQAQVMPFDTGHLQGDSFFPDYGESNKGRTQLVVSTPYARRLYYHPEYHFRTEENPNAKGAWFDDWVSNGKKSEFAKNAYKKFFKMTGDV